MDVSGTWMNTRHQYLSFDILIQSYIIYNISVALTLPRTLYSHKRTYTLAPIAPTKAEHVSVPSLQFSFNGPPDDLLFSSVLLVWPLVQSLPQLSTKTQDLSPLSGGEIWAWHFVVSLETWTHSSFLCAFFYSTRYSFSFGCIDKLNYAGSNCLFNLMKSSGFRDKTYATRNNYNKRLCWYCFQAACFYPSYLLIVFFLLFCCFDWAGRVLF